MSGITYEYRNPNDYLRNQVKELYTRAKRIAAINNIYIEDAFKEILDEVKTENYQLYVSLLQVMFLDYSVNLVLREEDITLEDECDTEYEDIAQDSFLEDEELIEEECISDIYEIETTEDLVSFAENNKFVLERMAGSIDVREIDLSYVYESMAKLSPERRKMLETIYPCFLYDYIEMHYPFILGKIQSNLRNNEFTKEISAKSVAIIDILHAMKEYSNEEYIDMVLYFLEIYYKHKKYSMQFFDSVITKKERELLRMLESKNIVESLIMVTNDDDLLEIVINIYSEFYFSDEKLVREVNEYFNLPEKQKEIKLIFKRKEGDKND